MRDVTFDAWFEPRPDSAAPESPLAALRGMLSIGYPHWGLSMQVAGMVFAATHRVEMPPARKPRW